MSELSRAELWWRTATRAARELQVTPAEQPPVVVLCRTVGGENVFGLFLPLALNKKQAQLGVPHSEIQVEID